MEPILPHSYPSLLDLPSSLSYLLSWTMRYCPSNSSCGSGKAYYFLAIVPLHSRPLFSRIQPRDDFSVTQIAHSNFYNSYISALDINSNWLPDWILCPILGYSRSPSQSDEFWFLTTVYIWNIFSCHSKQNVPIFTALQHLPSGNMRTKLMTWLAYFPSHYLHTKSEMY